MKRLFSSRWSLVLVLALVAIAAGLAGHETAPFLMGSVGLAPGYPDLSSSSTNKYTPQIYALEVLEKFYMSTVFGEIANTKYEGMITKQGDKVIVRTRPDVNVFDYVKGMNLREHRQTPESPSVELNIDKAKAYALNIDNIDQVQNDINAMEEWATDAGQQLAISIDRTILNDIDADASPYNKGATAGKISASYSLGATGAPAAVTKANAQDYIAACAAALSEQDVPEQDRWMVLPVWFCNLLEIGDLKRSDAFASGAEQIVLNGKVPTKLSGFTIYQSNNYVPVKDGSDSCYNIVYGHKSALTFASQLIKNRTFPDPDSFAEVMDGLQVYGYEVIKPEAMGVLYATKV
jgi:hypothetical protein